jgi:hypothetical protein
VHPGTSRRLPSGRRSVLAGMWPILAAAGGLVLLSTAFAWLLVWTLV